MTCRVLLVEPYLGGSHRSWAEGYAAHSRHEVHVVGHEGQFWRWRMRGGALTLAEDAEQAITQHGPPDAVLISDMVHVPAFLGYSRRFLGDPPVILYMHENQVLYPLGPRQQPDEALSIVNWMSLAAADRIWFNSRHHRDALFEALPRLLGRAPDRDHRHRLAGVEARSSVLPVGVDVASLLEAPRDTSTPPLVMWNQRWDHDKNPAALFGLLSRLADEGIEFRLALAGENERVDPREFFRVRRDLDDRVIHVGRLPRDAYVKLLLSSDVMMSTAEHEFFGVAAVEAAAAGVVPLLPNRLSYPELIPQRFHAVCLYEESESVDRLRAILTDLPAAVIACNGLREEMDRYDWSVVARAYDAEIEVVTDEYRQAR